MNKRVGGDIDEIHSEFEPGLKRGENKQRRDEMKDELAPKRVTSGYLSKWLVKYSVREY